MADAFTPNVNLTKPEVGASRDAWGGKWNDNADKLDAYLKTLQDQITNLQVVPVGTIVWLGTPNVPAGWLRCNGASLSRTTYADLFAAIGGLYGFNDANSFNIPDLRGLFVRGLDEGRGIDGGRGLGPQIQNSQNLSHTHGLTGGGYVFQLYGSGPNITLATGNEQAQPGVHAVNIAPDGGGEARPANIALPACIKY